jgi:4-amino-4-deoxy-L-arabinose transferase-like glycosyltransferase
MRSGVALLSRINGFMVLPSFLVTLIIASRSPKGARDAAAYSNGVLRKIR